MEIRRATAGDLGALRELYNTVCEEAFSWEHDLTETAFDDATQGEVVYVAVEGDEVIGLLSFWEADYFVHNLLVKRSARGRGVGKALLEFVRAQYKERSMTLKCAQESVDSFWFYIHRGWALLKIVDDAKVPYYLMELKCNSQKKDLPRRRDYIGAISWLKDVQKCLGDSFVFALDDAMMCHQYFSGWSDESIVWGYGSDATTQYKGVVLLGNQVSPDDIQEKEGLKYTNFNRTVADALANEDILHMQGTTEALSYYYYTHGESFDGVFVAPEYQDGFAELAEAAIDYYTY